MAQLFEYCAIYNPKPTKDNNGNDTTPASKLAVEVTRVLAKSEAEVSIQAARAIPAEFLDKLDQVTISIRPF